MKELLTQRVRQPKWQWTILLIVLGYEAAGALSGSFLLVAEPDGPFNCIMRLYGPDELVLNG